MSIGGSDRRGRAKQSLHRGNRQARVVGLYCGRCERRASGGETHRLAQRHMVQEAMQQAGQQGVAAYQQLWAGLEELSQLNAELLRRNEPLAHA